MSDAVVLPGQPIRLPVVSYGPFRLVEAVPWLMFATAMRIIQVQGGFVAIFAMVASHIAIFLAFLLAARRMIELAEGTTGLGKLSFRDQLILARKVMIPLALLILAVSLAVSAAGAPWLGRNLLLGFDGIAFDQFTLTGMGWSAFLAAVLLLMVLKAESGGRASLFVALRELGRRAACMVPAIAVLTVTDMLLSGVQGLVRGVVYAYWHADLTPQIFKTMIYFFFIFGFASLRLWVTLAILIFALRQSYRRGHALPALRQGAA